MTIRFVIALAGDLPLFPSLSTSGSPR